VKARSSETDRRFRANTTRSIRELFEQYVVPRMRGRSRAERGEGAMFGMQMGNVI